MGNLPLIDLVWVMVKNPWQRILENFLISTFCLKDQTRRETNSSLLADSCGQSTCDFTRDGDGGTLTKSDIGTGRWAVKGDAEVVRMEF